MPLFADIEHLLERVFERTSARVFRTGLQAVQLEHRVERAMELGRTVEDGRPVVPHVIRIRLAPVDLRSASGTGDADLLAARLAEAALDFARRNRFQLGGRPSVSLVADSTLASGEVSIEVGQRARTDRERDREAQRPVPPPEGGRVDLPSPEPGAAESAGSVASVEGRPSIRSTSTQAPGTMVYRRPAPDSPRARLREIRRDGSERSIELGGGTVSLGRARDNDIVIDDGRVSRHHGRLQARHGALVYVDLGSTNGSRVNGVRVDEIALGYGDRLELGDTVLVVETLPG